MEHRQVTANTDTNRAGRDSSLERVEALGTSTNHDHDPKLLIHVEGLSRFVHGFATKLNSGTVTGIGRKETEEARY